MELSFQIIRSHGFFSGEHFICISFDGIDFTVMYNEAVWMCTFPAWVGVCTETGMYHSNGRFIVSILKICKECTKLTYQEHTFIYNGTAGHGNYISIVITLFKYTAGNIKFPVKRQSRFHIFRFLDKGLNNVRHFFQSFVTKNFRTYRYGTISEEFHSFFFNDDFKHFFRLVAFQFILRKEKHGNTVFSFSADMDAFFFTGFGKEFMRNLKQDTNTVAGFTLCIFTGSVLQMFYDFQSIFNGFMAFDTFAVYYGTDTAVIMFELLSI